MSDLSKQQIRKQLIARRKAIGISERTSAERTIADKLLNEITQHFIDKTSSYIAIYHSMGSEVSTVELADKLTALGYKLAYPSVLGEGKMEFVDDQQILPPSQIAVMVVPLVAFNANRLRLGMGGGYYDRYLPRLAPDTPTIGIAFEQQLVKNLPFEPHDIALSAIITPSAVY